VLGGHDAAEGGGSDVPGLVMSLKPFATDGVVTMVLGTATTHTQFRDASGCRRIRVARTYWDAHNNRSCRGEREKALALYESLSEQERKKVPQVLRVWLRCRSEKTRRGPHAAGNRAETTGICAGALSFPSGTSLAFRAPWYNSQSRLILVGIWVLAPDYRYSYQDEAGPGLTKEAVSVCQWNYLHSIGEKSWKGQIPTKNPTVRVPAEVEEPR
jgi:hypothetical protein